MSRNVAKSILQEVDEAHPLLKDGHQLHQLPTSKEITELTAMKRFREELEVFLRSNGLNTSIVEDQWTAFLRLYASIIQDCPLTAQSEKELTNIRKVVVSLDEATKKIEGNGEQYLFFRVRWMVYDKSDDFSGQICTYFSIP